MKIPQQIETIAVSRVPNAAHYEYIATIRKRIEEITDGNEDVAANSSVDDITHP